MPADHATTAPSPTVDGRWAPIVPAPRPRLESSSQRDVGVVLVSRSRLLVNSLAVALRSAAGLRVLRTHERVDQVMRDARRHGQKPDVLVVEHHRSLADHVAELVTIRETWPSVPVVMTSVPAETTTVTACIEAGARGLLTVDSGLDELVSAIHTVAHDQAACSPSITTVMLGAIASGLVVSQPEHPTLTPRERQVVRLLERGMSNKEIARQLDISVATVKNHVHNILAKLDLSNRGRVRAHGRPRS